MSTLWFFYATTGSSSGAQPMLARKTLGGNPMLVTKGPTG